MKSAGLNSTHRTMLKKKTKMKALATHQESFLASKEKLKSLRMQAKQAQLERLKREPSPLLSLAP